LLSSSLGYLVFPVTNLHFTVPASFSHPLCRKKHQAYCNPSLKAIRKAPMCWVMLKLVTLAFIVTTLVGNFPLYWLRNPRGLYIDFGPLNTTLSCELRGHVSLGAPQAHM
jgi:hypothetical protein